MDYLPINILLRDRTVALVGAGTVAARKARFLLDAGARLRVIAPARSATFAELVAGADVDWRERGYRSGDLDGAVLAVAATPDSAVNQAVHDDAQATRLPVNVVDQPQLCPVELQRHSPQTEQVGCLVVLRWHYSQHLLAEYLLA